MNRPMRRLPVPLLLLLLGPLAASVSWGSPLHLYVATTGDDANSGTSPNQPFATLVRAREAVRASAHRDGVVVSIGSGRYHLAGTVEFAKEDSGTVEAPVVYQADEPGSVVFDGAISIPLASLATVTDPQVLNRIDPLARPNIRRVQLDVVKVTHGGPFPNVFSDHGGIFELFFNGQRLPMSRWPKSGYTTMKRVLVNGDAKTPGAFEYRDDRPLRWINNPSIWLKGKWRVGWEDPAIKVSSIDTTNHTITFAAGIPLGIGSKYKRPEGSGQETYCAINLIEEITSPGEWAIDFPSHTLYLWPPPAAPGAALQISQLDGPLIHINGASHLTFAGIGFEQSLGDGIDVENGDAIEIAGCRITNLAKRGVAMDAVHSTIQSCDISQVGQSCICLGGGDRKTLTASGNRVDNNHLHHYGVLKNQYSAAIDLGFATKPSIGATLSHNLVHHAPRDGFLVAGDDNTFEYNEAYYCGYDTADTGTFYSWNDWTIRNIVVRYNYIHDTVGGVNPDDGASGFVVYSNVFAGPRTGWWIASGPDNRFEHNIIIKDQGPVFGIDDRGISRGYATSKRLFAAVNSVSPQTPPWSVRFPTMVDMLQNHPELPWRTVVQENVIWIKSGEPFVNKMNKANRANPNLLEWKDNFVTADDPGFTNASAGNYALRSDSIVHSRLPNFPAIPFEKIGLYPDRWRSALPQRDPADNPFKQDTEKNFGT